MERVRAAFGSDPSMCWPWPKSVGSHGYGQIGWTEEGVDACTTAHRVAWVAEHGPIPTGMTVDHTCRNPVCINPAHLRLLSNPENAGDNRQAKRGRGRRSYLEVN